MYGLFGKFDCVIRSYYLNTRYIKSLQPNVKKHHSDYITKEKSFDLKDSDFKHSERLFTYNMESTFKTWANWKSLEEMIVFLISTRPSCKVCMVHMQKKFSELKKEKKFELNLMVISRLLGNQEPEFTHIKKIEKVQRTKNSVNLSQILVTEEN